ncbi:MAG: polysulfide reductase NrfD [Myxococcales bacterium]|nr:polysulfide reductase NrfD [Myxococcales bacterium]
MQSYGFIINNERCIGCHACSTACKSENSVPLGVHRTWVKSTETGIYPDTQRHFQVTRCNHCDNPPCVRICPTGAMRQMDNGIVEFDGNACIGCKACMQACPYDSIYIDPETNTAAKCHYCSHRVSVGMEPACVVVCPAHAIIAGDIADPDSEIARTLSRAKVTVRKPEQGTAPKLFYIAGSDVNLHPTVTERRPLTFAAADALPAPGGAPPREHDQPRANGDARRLPQLQGLPEHGPLRLGGRQAQHMAQVGYNAQHRVPWHWQVPAYLVTKAIGAGVWMLLALAWLLDLASYETSTAIYGGAVALLMMTLTTAFLVLDLERPDRFLYILLRPQWRSWLARGSVLLIGYSTLLGLYWGLETLGHLGVMSVDLTTYRPAWLLVLGLFGTGVAIYTAFLFGQAEGRDLWQNPLLPIHLVLQATMMGAAALWMAESFGVLNSELSSVVRWTLGSCLLADLFVILLGEFGMSHASEVAARAAHEISGGRFRHIFWGGAIVVGHALPLLLLTVATPAAQIGAAIFVTAGLYAYEYAFVMAPQEIPNA